MITLHHAQGTCMSAEIHEIHFDSFYDLQQYFYKLIDIDDKLTVYILGYNDEAGDLTGMDQDVFITENIYFINRYLGFITPYVEECKVVFLQEYKSYEEAYRVALSMRETSPLCYEN